jgi:translation elongation factor P/translation initiation factor 5A
MRTTRLREPDGTRARFLTMTTFDNLRTRKRQLESHLKRIVDPEEREKVEAELTKIDIALSFLEKEMPSQSTVSK